MIRAFFRLVTGFIWMCAFALLGLILLTRICFSNPKETVTKEVKPVSSTNTEWRYRANCKEDYDLLKTCKSVAVKLGYDPEKINEAYFTGRLDDDILGRTLYWECDGYHAIIVNNLMKNKKEEEQMSNIIHEVLHVYTGTDFEAWHKEMRRAQNIFPENYKYLHEDDLFDHR